MFNESRLLDRVAYGSQFGRQFKTRIVGLRSGHERRNADWVLPLGRYAILYQNLEPEHHNLVMQAHMACQGALIGFRFKDWTDYQATEQEIGIGTGAEQELQLTKTYTFGSLSFDRTILKPVSGTVTLFSNGTPIAGTVDYTTGIATLTATIGNVITWSGEFDVPVRFESDMLDVDPIVRRPDGFILSSDVDLMEIRL